MPTTTVAGAFDEFDDNLKLDPDERQKAIDCHNEIRDILRAEDYTVGAFLQGSFARKTMISPLRDIDMIVLIHPNLHRYVGEQTRLGFRTGAHGGPMRVMELLKAALEPHHPTATFSIGRHALTIDFGDGGFKFDVVPAFDTEEGPNADVLIANTETGGWERSNTRQLIADVAERNRACNGRLVHQVRMIKHAVKYNSPIGDGFFGLLGESLTFHAVTESLSHAEACAAVFEAGADMLAVGKVPDPTGDDNLCAKLDAATAVTAQRQFEQWAERARTALELEADGDEPGAVAIWHEVFGDSFPDAGQQSEAEAAKLWQGGAPTATGVISRDKSRRPVAPPSRSWRRFR